MRMLSLVLMAVVANTFAGEDAIQGPLSVRDAAVAKAKDTFAKAELAANTKLVGDLKQMLKRPGADKAAIASEIVKINANDAEALEVLNKEGKLAELGKTAAKETKMVAGRAVYKVWNDKGRLDYVGSGAISTVASDGRRLTDKFGTVKGYIEIIAPGEYKAQLTLSEGRISMSFAGKKVDWSKPILVPLQKGKYPFVVELEGAKHWSLKFSPKADAGLSVLGEPYLLTDPVAYKEAETTDAKFEVEGR